MGVCSHGDSESASKTEVGELEHAVAVNEQVLRLEIAVQHTVRMAEGDTLPIQKFAIVMTHTTEQLDLCMNIRFEISKT